jgi:hypothetical protein
MGKQAQGATQERLPLAARFYFPSESAENQLPIAAR